MPLATGCSTSTSISSSPRWRSCAVPELAGRPVVVGGDGNPRRPRQVVATASYEARRVRRPIRHAARTGRSQVPRRGVPPVRQAGVRGGLGPRHGDAAVVPGGGRGVGLGRSVRRGPHRRSRSVGGGHAGPPARGTRLSCAIGIGETRLQAKTATGFAKPAGVARLTRAAWIETMGAKPVSALWGIGTRTAERLAELGHRHRRVPGAGRPRAAGPSVRTDDRAQSQGARTRR